MYCPFTVWINCSNDLKNFANSKVFLNHYTFFFSQFARTNLETKYQICLGLPQLNIIILHYCSTLCKCSLKHTNVFKQTIWSLQMFWYFMAKKKSNNFSTGLLQTLYSRENNIMYMYYQMAQIVYICFLKLKHFNKVKFSQNIELHCLFVKPKTFESP